MNELSKEFKQWLYEEGKAEKTIESYVGDILGFQKYLDEMAVDASQPLTRFSFVRYKQYLIDNDFSVATINKKINSLKVYNDFLQMKGLVEESYIQLKKDKVKIAAGSEKTVEALSDEQVDKLLFYLEDHIKVSPRNKLIAYLLLYTGVRVSELVSIKMQDIDFLTTTLVVRGKGGKIREISLRQDLIHLIKQYIQNDRNRSKYKDSEYLLLSQRSPKVHHDAVRNWLMKISKELGFKLYPHLFRHTFCTRLLRKGVDLTTVSKLAGHSTINMTAKFYIQTTREEKQIAVEKL
ncbi:tyrosine-type recombinase/integrase [Heyndrickxia oleronia]|uniref:Integrase n=1 Tax=Heyndrickxia oleronia TaxID=38875 RepID=A0A8E2LF10_9BACI|nr:tyrosine-type recombinase/integrase [Heyndrickxia oleronia]MEC1375842.1 tyrosine-type recombinase/integrase [Heyndrickxia oleronia]OOP67714.1 integrase [Heyndrickxia oleronia]QQZ05560.1 tyrosine-type recombinase/integrase [Heyndrickxia oleronia]